jgi:hypothetical protein
MAVAYATFAARGSTATRWWSSASPLVPGRELEPIDADCRRVMSEEVADGVYDLARSVMTDGVGDGGAVRIINREGFVVETRTFPAPRNNPWWYLAPRPSTWVLGGLFFLQGVLGSITRRGDGVFFWMYVLMVLLGVAYISSLLISLRRDRRRVQQSDRGSIS